MWITFILLCSVFLFVIYFYNCLFRRKRHLGEPPLIPGHFILGSARDFSQNAIEFLHDCRKQFGNIFTVRLINKHITIIMDPHSIREMSKTVTFDFDPIQKQVNLNVFNFILKDSNDLLKQATKTLKGDSMELLLRNFHRNLKNYIENMPRCDDGTGVRDGTWTKENLRDFLSKTLFGSIFTTIFGNDPNNNFDPLIVHKNFDKFHQYFNYLWLGFSINLFPEGKKSLDVLKNQPSADTLLLRPDLSEYIRLAIEFMKARHQTEAEIIGHSLVFLHVNYNTFRLAYWCLYNIIKHKEAYTNVRQEINNLIDFRKSGYHDTDTSIESSIDVTTSDIQQMTILDSIVKESIRLTSGAFMIRYVTEDTEFTMNDGSKFMCRKDDRVAFYPPALHKDQLVFSEPLKFKYDRFVGAEFYESGRSLKVPIMGFGTLCPGKRLSLYQVKWFIIMALNKFEFHIDEHEETTTDNSYNGNEILPPIKDVYISYRNRSRKSTVNLNFS